MKTNKLTLAALAGLALTAGSANAVLLSQYGILDLTANGGINPNTGAAWADGDQYRLSFHTDETIAGESNDPATYDNFATAQAQQNAALLSSTGWTALVWVNMDIGQIQGAALSDPSVRAGITDITGGEIIGGAGVPVYAMDGTTSIARNNAVIMSGTWKSPFANVDSGWGATGQAADSAVRLPAGTGDSNSQTVHYAPFLDQHAGGDTGAQHGADVWTGGYPGSHVNAVGDASDNTDASRGSSNANNAGRVWNRFTSDTTSKYSVYAISGLYTISEVPEPSTTALLGLGGLALIFRRRK